MASAGETCTQCWVGTLQLHEGMLVCDVCGSIHQARSAGEVEAVLPHLRGRPAWQAAACLRTLVSLRLHATCSGPSRPNWPARACSSPRSAVLRRRAGAHQLLSSQGSAFVPGLAAGLCRGDPRVPDRHQRCPLLQVSWRAVVGQSHPLSHAVGRHRCSPLSLCLHPLLHLHPRAAGSRRACNGPARRRQQRRRRSRRPWQKQCGPMCRLPRRCCRWGAACYAL